MRSEPTSCPTCADSAVTARVVSVDGETAVVDREGTREVVALDLVPDATTGDLLLCHVGIALGRVETA